MKLAKIFGLISLAAMLAMMPACSSGSSSRTTPAAPPGGDPDICEVDPNAPGCGPDVPDPDPDPTVPGTSAFPAHLEHMDGVKAMIGSDPVEFSAPYIIVTPIGGGAHARVFDTSKPEAAFAVANAREAYAALSGNSGTISTSPALSSFGTNGKLALFAPEFAILDSAGLSLFSSGLVAAFTGALDSAAAESTSADVAGVINSMETKANSEVKKLLDVALGKMELAKAFLSALIGVDLGVAAGAISISGSTSYIDMNQLYPFTLSNGALIAAGNQAITLSAAEYALLGISGISGSYVVISGVSGAGLAPHIVNSAAVDKATVSPVYAALEALKTVKFLGDGKTYTISDGTTEVVTGTLKTDITVGKENLILGLADLKHSVFGYKRPVDTTGNTAVATTTTESKNASDAAVIPFAIGNGDPNVTEYTTAQFKDYLNTGTAPTAPLTFTGKTVAALTVQNKDGVYFDANKVGAATEVPVHMDLYGKADLTYTHGATPTEKLELGFTNWYDVEISKVVGGTATAKILWQDAGSLTAGTALQTTSGGNWSNSPISLTAGVDLGSKYFVDASGEKEVAGTYSIADTSTGEEFNLKGAFGVK